MNSLLRTAIYESYKLHRIKIPTTNQIIELDGSFPSSSHVIKSYTSFKNLMRTTIDGEGDKLQFTASDAIMPMSLFGMEESKESVYGVRVHFKLLSSKDMKEEIEKGEVDLTLVSPHRFKDALLRKYYVAGVLFGPYSLLLPIPASKHLKIIARHPNSMGFCAYKSYIEPQLKRYGVDIKHQFYGTTIDTAKRCCELIEEIRNGEAIEVDRWQLWAPALYLAKRRTHVKEFPAGKWVNAFIIRKNVVEELGAKAERIVNYLAERIKELNNLAYAYFASEMVAEIISKKMPEVMKFTELVEAYLREEEMAEFELQEVDGFNIHNLERLYKDYPLPTFYKIVRNHFGDFGLFKSSFEVDTFKK